MIPGFVPLERLVARLRCAPNEPHAGRKAALRALRARFAAQPSGWSATAEQRALAARLVELKRALSGTFDGVAACATCGHGEPLPKGRWAGGRCCGTRTEVVFTAAEVHALKVAGVRARDLVPPPSDAAGCAFRGERGCSLTPASRPTVCLVYACGELKAELRDSPGGPHVGALRAELHETFEAFLRASAVPVESWPTPGSFVAY